MEQWSVGLMRVPCRSVEGDIGRPARPTTHAATEHARQHELERDRDSSRRDPMKVAQHFSAGSEFLKSETSR
jgi:hypothetical protein